MFPWLVADIGGTNARFSLVTDSTDGRYQLTQTRDLRTGDYPTFEQCVTAYLDHIEGDRPTRACIAVAGPVTGDEVKLTNVGWVFSCEGVKQQLGFEWFEVLNDFAALACSVTHLGDEDLVTIVDGQAQTATKAIVGPGTGLGVAALMPYRNHWLPVPGEGGHVAYPPQTDREVAVMQVLREQGYVCAEKLLSGIGLVNTFNALAQVDGREERTEEPAEVTRRALEDGQPLALEALELFCCGLGTVAGDAVVNYAAKGGLYLGGGILPRMVEFLKSSGFAKRLRHKGVMSGLFDNLPVYLIVHSHPALIGAAAWLDDNQSG
ncbi:glucokinase [Pseudomaricurvus alkylphenolicus]|uniref:glucokinase n=1 Tax=Pseudomaricurvus alkylphenolicus TaxID=1306991 RepID=UPI00141E6911|nr:glucokinase [Pseudomaricurvus alkylphenolicus]NIB41547.1 glucokinase [Pseudomaricurvus alkylphenolicus]